MRLLMPSVYAQEEKSRLQLRLQRLKWWFGACSKNRPPCMPIARLFCVRLSLPSFPSQRGPMASVTEASCKALFTCEAWFWISLHPYKGDRVVIWCFGYGCA